MGQVKSVTNQCCLGHGTGEKDIVKPNQESGLAGRAMGNNRRDSGGGLILKFSAAAGSQV